MRFQGKTALVTGSGRGIGRAIAVRFAREGGAIVINYGHHDDEARETLSQVEAAGGRGVVVKADMSVVAEIQQLVDESVRRLGGLDILVNNAGIEKEAPFLEVAEADYDKVLAVNLKGAFFAAQAFARHRVAVKQPGRIVNISSVHEVIPFPGFAAYCASKGGMRLLTRDLAVELGPHGITVNGIAPGAVLTEINQRLMEDPAKKDALLRQIPLGRLGTVEDVAGVATFLASDDANYVTGSTYFVDGGLTWFYEE